MKSWKPMRVIFLWILILCTIDGKKPPIRYRHRVSEFLADAKWDNLEDLVEVDRKVKLIPYPPLLKDGSNLVISYSDVSTPHTNDFITLSCGPLAHPNDFLMKLNVNPTESSVRFPALFMMRCNYVATYYNYNPKLSDFQAVGSIEIPMKDPFTSPRHGHISFTSHLDEMAVMFNSASNYTPSVQYGLDPQALSNHATGTSTTYHASDMCEAPANITSQQWFRDPGYMHTVILTHLNASTTYFYRYGNDRDGWSDIHSFLSRASPSSKHAKFLAYADMGVDSAPAAISTAVRSYQEVTENGFDHFLLHFGDVSYARGHAHIWDEFFYVIEPYATRVPYMVSIGNHEYDYQSGGREHDPSGAFNHETNRMAFTPSWGNYGTDSCGECAVPMVHRWHTPSNGHGLFWYSFNERGVHVIQLSSEHDWTRGSAQYQWLEHDLQHVDRNETPWIVLTAHRMMYTTQLGEDPDLKVSIHFRHEMEELLWKYRVNLMLVGHQHSYERSCPVYQGECTKDGIGPVHIIVGSAGAGLETSGFSDKIGKWSVSHVNDWGYLRIESNEKEMNVQFILNRDGEVYDQVILQPWE